MSQQIAQTVQQCAECAKNSTPNKEPLMIAQLSMGQRIRTPIPQTNKLLVPNWAYLKTFREKNEQFKQSQKRNFDKRHRASELTPIPDDTEVWITSERQSIQGKVISHVGSPRSYVVSTPSGEVHRNRSHLNIVLNMLMYERGHLTECSRTTYICMIIMFLYLFV